MLTAPTLCLRRANYADPRDCAALIDLLDAYARDPMGGGEPLPEATRATLCERLAALAGAASWIAWVGDEPAGLINTLPGFSTFKALPLLNVHDIAVLPAHRGRGIGQQLLAAAEAHARALGCCKLTLEVLTGNAPARAAYRQAGFEDYALDPAMGQALLMQKWLD